MNSRQARSRRRKQQRVALKQAAKAAKKSLADTSSVSESMCTPESVHTYRRQPTTSIDNFAALLAREPPLTQSAGDEAAFELVDYCREAQRMLETVIKLLESFDGPSQANMARLNVHETRRLRQLRAMWLEHLRANLYTLMAPPPASGGSTARYSIAVQLWLLVAHANCVLQLSSEVSQLDKFYPPGSAYLSRNCLVVDDNYVMRYPQRTLLLALDRFTAQLDCMDRLHKDYLRYATALEHRLSVLLCHTGSKTEYNAAEWCLPNESEQDERCSEEFMQCTMVQLLTIYQYAENWCALNVMSYYDPLRNRHVTQPIRWPAHCVDEADWVPSARSMRRLIAFLCKYAHSRQDANYVRSIHTFLMQFELRPHELDQYRMLQRTLMAHARTVLHHEFRGQSQIGRTYMHKVHYDRSVFSYVRELLQFEQSDDAASRTAALANQGRQRQLGALFVLHQFLDGKFRLDFKARFVLFQRDPSFVTQLQRACSFPYPIIVQQFSRFSVFVPHRRPPQQDAAEVCYWRSLARAERRGCDAPPQPLFVNDQEGDDDCGQHVRVYDCLSSLDAFAVWALWFLQLASGRVDDSINLCDFLVDLFDWRSSYWRPDGHRRS